LDAARVKLDFPILARPVHGKPLVYLDSANSAQKPRAVIDRIVEVYESGYANVHRGVYHLGVVATDAYEGARDKVAAFLNAPSRREVIFTRQATEALNLVAYAYGRNHVGPGDHIVTTELEFPTVGQIWHAQEERGARVVHVEPALGTALVVSFPRDTEVAIEGHGRDKLNAAFRESLKPAETRALLATLGADIKIGTPADLGKMLAGELTLWTAVVKDAHIKLE